MLQHAADVATATVCSQNSGQFPPEVNTVLVVLVDGLKVMDYASAMLCDDPGAAMRGCGAKPLGYSLRCVRCSLQ